MSEIIFKDCKIQIKNQNNPPLISVSSLYLFRKLQQIHSDVNSKFDAVTHVPAAPPTPGAVPAPKDHCQHAWVSRTTCTQPSPTHPPASSLYHSTPQHQPPGPWGDEPSNTLSRKSQVSFEKDWQFLIKLHDNKFEKYLKNCYFAVFKTAFLDFLKRYPI